jgi:hypothetical protein
MMIGVLAMNKVLSVVNQLGVPFNVKVSKRKGELEKKYGVIVEFYDARFIEGFTKYGQFVSGYYAKTMLEHGANGLALDCGIDDWQVSSENMQAIIDWMSVENINCGSDE